MTDLELSPEARAAFRHWGRIGGLRRAATSNPDAMLGPARAAQEAKWLLGHGCRVCGERIDIPTDLPLEERQRRATALRKLHYVRMGGRGGGQKAANRRSRS